MSAAQIAVVGSGSADAADEERAEEVGRRLAQAGATLVCGGLGGVMAAACRGAKAAGGTTVGILPGEDRNDANPWVDLAVATGLGEGRNFVIVRSADAVVAIGGEYGTLSEIALALREGVDVVGLSTWSLTRPGGGSDAGIKPAADPAAAVALAMALAAARIRSR